MSFKNNRHRQLTVAALAHPNLFSDEGKYKTPICLNYATDSQICKSGMQLMHTFYIFLSPNLFVHAFPTHIPFNPQLPRLTDHFVPHRVDN